MTVVVLGYDFPHKKTIDVLLRLSMSGEEVVVVAAGWQALPASAVRTAVRRQIQHPKDVAAWLGYEYVASPHDSADCLRKLDSAEIGVVAGARILTAEVIRAPKLGILNLHPALLPAVRGLDSLLWLVYLDVPLGVSAHIIDEHVDCGRLIRFEPVDIMSGDTVFDLSERLYDRQIEMVVPTIASMRATTHAKPLEGEGQVRGRMSAGMAKMVISRRVPEYIAARSKGVEERMQPRQTSRRSRHDCSIVLAQREFEAHAADYLAASERVLRSGSWILGPEVSAFEAEAASYLDVRDAVGVASGSDALILALKALGVGRGDGVVTTPSTFFATAGAIANVGATPVFADIDPVTLNLDPACVRYVLEGRSPVHARVGVDPRRFEPSYRFTSSVYRPTWLPSLPSEKNLAWLSSRTLRRHSDRLGRTSRRWDRRYRVLLVLPHEESGWLRGCGMVVTNSGAHGERLRLLRAHGARIKYVNEVVGMNSRMDTLQAALLRVGLQHLESSLTGRRRHAAAYDAAFRDVSSLLIPPAISGRTYHQYVISLPDRERVRASLTRSNIETAIHYPVPLHLHPALFDCGYATGDFPVSEMASQRVLSLPIFPTMTDEERSAVIGSVFTALEAGVSEERAQGVQASTRS